MVTSTRGSPRHQCMCQPASVRQEESGLILSINGHQHPEQSPSSTSRRGCHPSISLGADSVVNVCTWSRQAPSSTSGSHQHCLERTPSSMYVVCNVLAK